MITTFMFLIKAAHLSGVTRQEAGLGVLSPIGLIIVKRSRRRKEIKVTKPEIKEIEKYLSKLEKLYKEGKISKKHTKNLKTVSTKTKGA